MTFCLYLIPYIIISFIIGGGLCLITEWISNSKVADMYEKAGLKKKPNIMLGINTASYLYVLHKIFMTRKIKCKCEE